MKIKLTAGPPAYGGYTVARLDGKVVMLKGAIPGETVEAEMLQEKKDYSVAEAVTILEPSPERVEPPAPTSAHAAGARSSMPHTRRRWALSRKSWFRRSGG